MADADSDNNPETRQERRERKLRKKGADCAIR